MHTKHGRGFTFIEVLISLAIIIILLMTMMKSKIGINLSHGTGEKMGNVVSINYRGLMKPTWEAQIIRGGISDGSGAFGTPFNFTVEDPALLAKLQEYSKAKDEVVIRYRIEGLYSPFRSESGGNFLTDIEPAKK